MHATHCHGWFHLLGASLCPLSLNLTNRLLLMCFNADYPQSTLAASLLQPKGLGDSRKQQLLDTLLQEATSMQGELCMGHLVQTAKDWLTAHNVPEGDCAFCLLPLVPVAASATCDSSAPKPSSSSSTTGAATKTMPATAAQCTGPLVRVPCFHSFHGGCYREWWVWQQQRLEAEEKLIKAHTGNAAASAVITMVR